MVEVLRAFGVQAASVDTEAAALAALREARGEGGAPFEAALCDWRLRDGEDGLAAAQRLRAAGGGLHVLMVTGETDPLRLQALQASGAAGAVQAGGGPASGVGAGDRSRQRSVRGGGLCLKA